MVYHMMCALSMRGYLEAHEKHTSPPSYRHRVRNEISRRMVLLFQCVAMYDAPVRLVMLLKPYLPVPKRSDCVAHFIAKTQKSTMAR